MIHPQIIIHSTCTNILSQNQSQKMGQIFIGRTRIGKCTAERNQIPITIDITLLSGAENRSK
jgi:hypothetical protein